jgi:hypothetical protein
MAFKLNKSEEKRFNELLTILTTNSSALSEAFDTLKEDIKDLIDTFNDGPLAAYNEGLETVRGFVEDIHSERTEDYDDKSERWQEGDNGQAAYEWLNELESLKDGLEEIEGLTIDNISEFEMPEHSDAFEAMPLEAGY